MPHRTVVTIMVDIRVDLKKKKKINALREKKLQLILVALTCERPK